jgi:cytochrome c-type biogenesis protein
VGGTLGTYALFGFAGSLLGSLVSYGSWIYGAVAAAALIGGVITLVGAVSHSHDHPDDTIAKNTEPLSAAFLAGIGFALMISPCCTPILGVILTYTALKANMLVASAMLVVFGLGHATPLLLVVFGGRRFTTRLWSSKFAQAAQVFAGTCMIALGSYYALLV